MYYINLFIIALLLASCSATNQTSSPVATSGLNPNEQSESEHAKYKKAISLLNNNKLDAAKEIFLQFNEERPELAGPYANLAIIALKQEQPKKALELVQICLSKNSKLPQALNLLAYLEQRKGEAQSAEKHYLEAIKYKNNYALAHYNLALLYDIYFQDIAKAIPHYEIYLKLTNYKDKNTADWLEQIKRTKGNG